MAQHTLQVTQQSSRPLSELFGFLARHSNLSRVFLLPVVRIKDGEDAPDGVGSVRRLGPPIVGVEETVTALEQDRFIEYRITRNGGPIQNHRGRLDFSQTDRGSQIRWTIEFDAALPVLGKGVSTVLEQGLKMGLKRIA